MRESEYSGHIFPSLSLSLSKSIHLSIASVANERLLSSFPPKSFLDPKDAIPPTNASATCQLEYKYLYCTPGTKTYIFFGTLPSSPNKPDEYASTLKDVTAFVAKHIHDSGDGLLQNGDQYFITSGSPVQIYAQDAPRHNLTYGVLGAALRGLAAWMAAPANGYSDATFQINDGENWVGSGYVGSLNGEGQCVFKGSVHPNQTCSATDVDGFIYGYDGGRFCG